VTISEHTIDIGSLQWFYRQTEEGDLHPPVLLLHGLPAHSYTWRKLMTALAETGRSSIAPDWIGCGFSSKPSAREFAYTPEAFLTALSDFIDALQLEKFYLVVQGYLSSVGIQYAFNHSDRVEKLVILNTPISNDVKLPWQMQQCTIPLVGDMMTQDPLLVDRTLEKGSGFIIADEDLNVFRKPFLQTSAVGRALMTSLKQLQLKSTMESIENGWQDWQSPTLLVWGMSDPWLNSTAAQNLAKSHFNIDLLELPEAKHYPQEHWGKEISEPIIQFFRRQVV
jgi:pimeloyl-ACP methyl ester carboxylesterase